MEGDSKMGDDLALDIDQLLSSTGTVGGGDVRAQLHRLSRSLSAREAAVRPAGSPRFGEGSGVWVEDLEAEKKRYLTQKQKKRRSENRGGSKLSLRELAEGSLSSSSSAASSGSLSSSSSATNAMPSSGEQARTDNSTAGDQSTPNAQFGGTDSDRGTTEATTQIDNKGEEATEKIRSKEAMKEDEDPFGDDEDEEKDEEEWERSAAEAALQDASGSATSTSASGHTIDSTEPASESSGETAAAEENGDKGAKGNNIFSQIKSLVGNIGAKVSTGRDDEDEDDDDENEDVWDELRVRTLRNTLVNKHMSHLDLNSKQIELVNVKAEAWEDVFKVDESKPEDDKVARSTFSRWDVQNETVLAMLLAIRMSVADSKRRTQSEEIAQPEFKTCRSCTLAVGGLGTKITIKDYAPLVFDQLRLASGVTYEEYLKAWSDSKIGSEEDDDEIIAYSSDRRFVIHRISSDQAKVLANILPTYYMYIKTNPQSMIERYFGLHQIGIKGKKIYFTVLGNVFGAQTVRQLKENFFIREPQTEERRAQRRDSTGRTRSRTGTFEFPSTPASSSPRNTKRGKAASPLGKKTSATSSPSGSDSESQSNHHSDSYIPISVTPATDPCPTPPPINSNPSPSLSVPSPTSTVSRAGSGSPSTSPGDSPPTSPFQARRRRTLLGFLSRSVEIEGIPSSPLQSQEPHSLSLTAEQKKEFLAQLVSDTKWLAQTGLSSYVLTVGVSSPQNSVRSPKQPTPTHGNTKAVPSMVCFMELPSREAKKASKLIHSPLPPDHPPSPSVLKQRKSPPPPPRRSTSDDRDSAEGSGDAKFARYHAGILGKQKEKRCDSSRAKSSTEAAQAASGGSEDDDMGFFLHLRQGARKMSMHLSSESPTITTDDGEAGTNGSAERKKKKKGKKKVGAAKDGEAQVDGEPSTERFHLSLTDILHKHASRGTMWGKMMGGGSNLTAAQYAQSLCDAVTEKLIA